MNLSSIIINMIDAEVLLEASAIGLGTGLSALFYYFHSRHIAIAKEVEDTPLLPIDNELISTVKECPGQCLPYVAVSGMVAPEDKTLHSRFFHDKKGVIVNFITEERKETWAKYVHAWHENEREVCNITETVPFCLVEKNQGSVSIVDPLESSWCMGTLDVVHKEFRVPNSSIMDSIMGMVSGDRIKGYTDTEKMLRVGTQLIGIGELFVEDNVLKLRKPPPSTGEFIITRMTQKGVVSHFRSKSKLWKVIGLILFGASAVGLYYFVRKMYKKYDQVKGDLRRQEEIDEIRRQRSSDIRGRGNASERQNQEDDCCVVCLTNPRECVILECGHICACVDCIESLPHPKICPMCRHSVKRIIPLFHA